MFNFIIRPVVKKLEQHLKGRGKYVIIPIERNGEKVPYLIRYVLFYSKYFSVFIHRFMISDDPVPHDHPWPFFTYVVEGEYMEERYVDKDSPKTYCHRYQGSLAYRRPEDIHRVVLMGDKQQYSILEYEDSPLTICIIGRDKRKWGFYPTDSERPIKRHFVEAKEFLGIDPMDSKYRNL